MLFFFLVTSVITQEFKKINECVWADERGKFFNLSLLDKLNGWQITDYKNGI